jgi:hypothetical protein
MTSIARMPPSQRRAVPRAEGYPAPIVFEGMAEGVGEMEPGDMLG